MSELGEQLLVAKNLKEVFDKVVLLESVVTPAESLQGTLADSFLECFQKLSTLIFILDIRTTNVKVFKPARAIDQTN